MKAFSFLALALLAGCGAIPQDCEFNCEGCCTPQGQCLAGTSASACGWGGKACTSCPSGQTCDKAAGGGECASCNSFNCDGCCDGYGRCVAGTSDDACGNFANRCVACTGGATCRPRGVGGGVCD